VLFDFALPASVRSGSLFDAEFPITKLGCGSKLGTGGIGGSGLSRYWPEMEARLLTESRILLLERYGSGFVDGEVVEVEEAIDAAVEPLLFVRTSLEGLELLEIERVIRLAGEAGASGVPSFSLLDVRECAYSVYGPEQRVAISVCM
jgi:hypothetical protein